MEPRVQYARTTDGVNIAYSVAGEGPILVRAPTPGIDHAQRDWAMYAEVWATLLPSFRIVLYDARGTGLSDRGVVDFSLAAMLRDADAVMEKEDIAACPFIGFHHGVMIALAYAAAYPDRVSHLILADGGAGPPQTPAASAAEALLTQDWDLFVRTVSRVLSGSEGQRDEAWTRLWDEHVRASCDRDVFREIWRAYKTWDVRELLGSIRAPTLVIYLENSLWNALSASRELAARIPGARLATLGDTPRPFQGVHRLIEEFLGEGREQRQFELPSGTAVILFADIADSTALTERLGDGAFREKARDLDAALRSVIRECGGTPVEGKLLGDGVLAVFASARQAIEAALCCGRTGDTAGLSLHLGIHAGDVIREENNVYGGAVNTAARIAATSAPGQVLVSDTVRGLARTSAGVAFEEQGEHELKGIGEPQRLWAVREGAG